MTTPDNPYASPQIQPPPPKDRPVVEQTRALPPIGKSLLKWTLACGIAAAPSFFFGSNIAHPTCFLAACGGMVAGIAVFIVLYVFAERTQRTQHVLAWRFARTTAWIGYGTRVAISIIFPVGMFPDIFCGVFSVGISQWFLGGDIMINSRNLPAVSGGDYFMIFTQFMLTTVIQGILLNLVLFGYMIFVFGICHLLASLNTGR